MLEGYVLVLLGARTFIGRYAEGHKLTSPFEAHIQFEMDGRGNFGIIRECVPVIGSATLKEIAIPSGAVVIKCEDLSGKEREHWAGAIRQAEALTQAIRGAESGIVVAGANAQVLGK